jgi:hypothetical protein
VIWRAFTDAKIELAGGTVKLWKKDATITLRQVSGGGVWSVADAKPPNSAENPNKGFKALVLTVPKSRSLHIVVEIKP